MLDIFSGLRLVIKRRPINIDNTIFRFHWFLTSTILVSFSLIITARQYVGQPIECHSIDKIPETLLNSYCWVQSTFTVPQACNQRVGIDVPYPCIDNTRGREIKMFAYYQWVGIVLFIQGILFHLPYYLWKLWEAGLIRAITGGLRVAVLSDIERCKKKDIVIEYLDTHLGCHKHYALKYFLCEFGCLINLFLQLWATDRFFDGQFLHYGLDVIRYSTSDAASASWPSTTTGSNYRDMNSNNDSQSSLYRHNNRISQATDSSQRPSNNSSKPFPRIDPMTFVFPRITKCTYYDFGSSGDIQKHDAICLLPLNIVNEKIYIALWFWFLILAVLTLAVIICRLFLLCCKKIRAKFLITRCKLSLESDLHIICQRGDVGDWFLFYMMASNIDPLIMREIVSVMAERFEIRLKKEKEALECYSATDRSDQRRNYSSLAGRDDLNTDTLQSAGKDKSISFKSLGTRLKLSLNRLFNKGKRLFYRRHSLSSTTTASTITQQDTTQSRCAHLERFKRLNSGRDDQRNHLFGSQRVVLDVEEAQHQHPFSLGAATGDNTDDNNQYNHHSMMLSSPPVFNYTTTATITIPHSNNNNNNHHHHHDDNNNNNKKSTSSYCRQSNSSKCNGMATMNHITLSLNDRSKYSPYKNSNNHQHHFGQHQFITNMPSPEIMEMRRRNMQTSSLLSSSSSSSSSTSSSDINRNTSPTKNSYLQTVTEENHTTHGLVDKNLAIIERVTVPAATAPPISPSHDINNSNITTQSNTNSANHLSYPRLDYQYI